MPGSTNDGKKAKIGSAKRFAGKRRPRILDDQGLHARPEIHNPWLNSSSKSPLRRLGHRLTWTFGKLHECVYGQRFPIDNFAKDGRHPRTGGREEGGQSALRRLSRGHKESPAFIKKMLSPRALLSTPCKCPSNVFDFELPELRERSAASSHVAQNGRDRHEEPGRQPVQAIIEGIVTIEEALRYAMSVPGVLR